MTASETRTGSDVARQIVTLIVILGGAVAANVLGLSFAGNDTGDLANQAFSDTVFFFPATYVFATIWPVIYLGLVGLAIHQALPSQATNPRYRRGGLVLAINLVLNAAWVAIFGAELFVWSLVAIVPILVTAVLAYSLLQVSRTPEAPAAERVFKVAVAIYTAWLTIAVVANVSAALASIGWNGFGLSYETWGVLICAVGIGLGILLLVIFRDPTFALTYAYAYLGILVRRFGTYESVALTAGIGAGVFAVLFIVSVVVLIRRPQQ